MNAVSLYVSASRILFQPETEDPNFSDLYRLVPYLRQSLSCTVCANLLIEPFSPQDVCQHHVCRTCIGGRKNLKPTCLSCRNYQNYHANTQLRILLQCYKSLCNYILASPVIYSSMHKHLHVDGMVNGNNETYSLAELIDEGARFHDEYKSSSGLSKSAFSILPCIFTTAAQQSHQSNNLNVVSLANINKCTKISTIDGKDSVTLLSNTSILPNTPIKTVSNGSALYSVMYAGSGNKITIKRKTDDSGYSSSSGMSAKEMLNILSGNSSSSTSSNSSSSGHFHQQSQSIQLQPQLQLQQPQQQQFQQYQQTQSQSFKKPSTSKTNKQVQKRRGCRCGNATPTPGKLTCCGQRCPCYVESKSCIDCKCRGCRNPHRVGGFKVRPQIPELTCFVQMNSDSLENSYMDLPLETFTTSSENSSQFVDNQNTTAQMIETNTTQSHHALELHNDTIEYIPNELDDSNIQVVNVYTTHLGEVSTTLPTIIMQEEPSMSTSTSSPTSLSNLPLPTECPPYSLLGDDILSHSFSDDGCTSDDQSDIEIDI